MNLLLNRQASRASTLVAIGQFRGTRIATATKAKPESPPRTVDVMKPPLFKIAAWASSIGFCVYLLSRLIRRRRASIDVGTVSDEWLAQRRGVADESVSYH